MVQTGGLLAGVLLGVPPIEVFTANGDIPTVGSAASVWFLTFFCPFDLFYRVCCLSWMKVSHRWSIVYPILIRMHSQDTTAIFFPLSRITAGVVWEDRWKVLVVCLCVRPVFLYLHSSVALGSDVILAQGPHHYGGSPHGCLALSLCSHCDGARRCTERYVCVLYVSVCVCVCMCVVCVYACVCVFIRATSTFSLLCSLSLPLSPL